MHKDDKQLLSEKQLWKGYGLSVPWLRRARRERRGPRFLKLGKMVRYRVSDVEDYLSAHEVGPDVSEEETRKAADSQSVA